MKRILSSFCFVGIGVFLFLAVQNFLVFNEVHSMHSFSSFYALKEKSVDVVVLGSSQVGRGWLADVARKEFNIKSFALFTSGQHPSLILPIVREVKLTQDPKLWVVDLSMLTDRLWSYTLNNPEGNLRSVVDNMRSSVNCNYAIDQMAHWCALDAVALKSNLPIFKYHSNWWRIPEIIKYRLGMTEVAPNDSYERQTQKFPAPDYVDYKKEPNLSVNCRTVCQQICKGFRTFGDNVIFTIFPCADVDEMTFANYLAIEQIVSDNGFAFVNLNFDRKMVLDSGEDFSDHVHLNIKGATKVTNRLCEAAMRQCKNLTTEE